MGFVGGHCDPLGMLHATEVIVKIAGPPKPDGSAVFKHDTVTVNEARVGAVGVKETVLGIGQVALIRDVGFEFQT